MVLNSTTTHFDFSGYCILEQLYAGSRTEVYRAIRDGDSAASGECQQSVVIKLLRQQYPTIAELVQFRNQYTIAKNLNHPGIIQPYSLEPFHNGYALVMEDFGGISLRQFAQGEALSLALFLPIALQIIDILHPLHQQRIIHKDIKPANILIHPDTRQIKLIDFSIASLLPRETQEIQNPGGLEGTLAYLSPEQTGRMNRGIDYRSDFYSLGVTFFELLTGQLPFQANDAMELVHCHIAKSPPSVCHLNPTLPRLLGQVIHKLMAKNAEDRYQSAIGLKHDLLRCQELSQELSQELNQELDREQGQTPVQSIEFELGQHDISDRFLIPEKLYGRQAEVEMLLAAFGRVANGAAELLLVSGFSGIGKTAVVNEVHKPIVQCNGYFIKGKFDQFNRNIPLSAFVQSFRDLIGQLLGENDTQLAQWRTKILAAVGENGQVMIEVIPELEQIIGKQAAVPELSGNAAQNRFNLVFQQFIRVFTAPEHPLVMFLDDLQWADSASLQLIKLLISQTETAYLLMVGAYRDNEVFAAHPLRLTLDEIEQSATVNTITLTPLSQADVNRLIGDTLSCSIDRAVLLTELVDQKAKGNPFFITQFLKALYEDRWITFDWEAGSWQCNVAQVRSLALTDDVVQFMALQLQKLPAETQHVLKLAACIGNQFDLNTLAIVSGRPPEETATDLWKALQEGFAIPTNQIYKFFSSKSEQGIAKTAIANDPAAPPSVAYKFLHDRVQQAAYSLIAEEQRPSIHLKMGQLLLKHTSDIEQDNKLFDIVNHLNQGSGLITQPTEQEQIARLNLFATQKARSATAYESALTYATTGIALLSPDCWQSQYELALELHELAAENAFLSRDFEQMEHWVETVLQQAKTPLDRVKIYEIKIQTYISQHQPLAAIALGKQVLRQFGIQLPDQPTQEDIHQAFQHTVNLFAGRPIEELVNLPPMTASEPLAAILIAASTAPAIYFAAPSLYPLLALSQVNASIQHGNAPVSAFFYACYGLLLNGILGDVEAADRAGKLALGVLEKLNAREVECKTRFILGAFVVHGTAHLQTSLQFLRESYQIGLETGDIEFAGHAAFHSCQYSYFSSQELGALERDIHAYSQMLKNLKQVMMLNYCQLLRQVALNLLGRAENPGVLVGEAYDETQFLPQLLVANDQMGLHFFYLHKLILGYLFGDTAQSLSDIATQGRQYSAAGFITVPIFYFYDSLAALSRDSSAGSEFGDRLQRVAENQAKLQKWAHHAPMNHLHKWHLVEAERCRVLGQKAEAVELYDRAIALAKAHHYLQEEALASELAAKFYLEWDKPRLAQEYMTEAYYGYVRWGAKAKVADLEGRYPQLLAPVLQQTRSAFSINDTIFTLDTTSSTHASISSSTSSNSVSDTLDLSTILKVSQTLSGEIELEKLLSTLLNVAIENAGADQGVLMLRQEDLTSDMPINDLEAESLWVEGVAHAESPPIVLQHIPVSASQNIPQKLIYTVKRRLQALMLADATAHPEFANDPYILQQQPKSILCCPILNRGQFVGILYLENNLTKAAFSRDRVELLNLLCTQAAISIENARLYAKAQVYAQSLERSLKGQELLFEVVCDIRRSLDVNTISTVVTQRVRQILAADRVAIYQFDRASDRASDHSTGAIVAEAVAPEFPSALQVPVADHCFGERYAEYYQQGRVHVVSDLAEAEVEPCYRQILEQFAIKANLAAPILWRGELWGLLCVHQCSQARHWSAEEIQFTKQMAAQLSVALEQAKLLYQTCEQSTQLEQTLQHLQQTQVQLVQNEKMSALGNLVAGVAHEINNPIGFIAGNIAPAKDYVKDLLGLIDLYQETYPDPSQAIDDEMATIDLEYVRKDLPKLIGSMQLGVDRIRDISTSLRTFSRADKDYKVPFNIHEGIDSTILILKHRLKANDDRPAIEIVTDYGNLPAIDCFPGQLNQVFMNILANAIDALEEASRNHSFEDLKADPNRIEIQTKLNDSGAEAIIQIRDNGIGMPSEVKERVFDHLFTTKGVGKGTGLGLAIARQIVVEQHGGSIEVNSALGQGTEFMIRLPAKSKL